MSKRWIAYKIEQFGLLHASNPTYTRAHLVRRTLFGRLRFKNLNYGGHIQLDDFKVEPFLDKWYLPQPENFIKAKGFETWYLDVKHLAKILELSYIPDSLNPKEK